MKIKFVFNPNNENCEPCRNQKITADDVSCHHTLFILDVKEPAIKRTIRSRVAEFTAYDLNYSGKAVDIRFYPRTKGLHLDFDNDKNLDYEVVSSVCGDLID